MVLKEDSKLIFCACDCGELIPNRSKNGEPRRFKNFHQNRGINNPHYNNGVCHHSDGYRYISAPNHPYATKLGFVFEHRLIMEQHLGRYLVKGEVVHHINHNKHDNKLENLQLMTDSEHKRHHARKQGLRHSQF